MYGDHFLGRSPYLLPILETLNCASRAFCVLWVSLSWRDRAHMRGSAPPPPAPYVQPEQEVFSTPFTEHLLTSLGRYLVQTLALPLTLCVVLG